MLCKGGSHVEKRIQRVRHGVRRVVYIFESFVLYVEINLQMILATMANKQSQQRDIQF